MSKSTKILLSYIKGSLLVMSKLPIIILKKLICSIESFDIQNIITIFARNISGDIMCNIKYYIDETAAYFGINPIKTSHNGLVKTLNR